MRQFARRLTAALLFLLVVASGLAAQNVEPAWLKVERADRFASEGEYGRAIQLYREALELQPNSADALFGLGRAFASAGDYPVAEFYLNDARANRANLRVPDASYEILYSLSYLYEVQRRFSDLETVLSDIIALADAEAADRLTVRANSTELARVLANEGLDRLLVLYRRPEDGATVARGDLCELLVGLGRYDGAISQGLTAVLQQFSTLIDAIMARDPLYEYSTARGVVEAAGLYPETRDYLEKTPIYRDLYYLAAAEYSAGRTITAFDLWRLLADLPGAGQSAVRARIQLADPRDEPLLVPPN